MNEGCLSLDLTHPSPGGWTTKSATLWSCNSSPIYSFPFSQAFPYLSFPMMLIVTLILLDCMNAKNTV